jgi:hypothetical protein
MSTATSDWQLGFLQILPAVKTHAAIRFRQLRAERREEAIQETIAAACVNYQLAAAQGKLNVVSPGPLADFAVRHVKTGRHVGGHQDAAKDVISPACQRRLRVIVRSIDVAYENSGWKQLAVADCRASIPDVAALRIDFSEWLKTLTRRDRQIVDILAQGHRTMEVAERFRVTPGRISQLRCRFERSWRVFQGEGDSPAAAA